MDSHETPWFPVNINYNLTLINPWRFPLFLWDTEIFHGDPIGTNGNPWDPLISISRHQNLTMTIGLLTCERQLTRPLRLRRKLSTLLNIVEASILAESRVNEMPPVKCSSAVFALPTSMFS